MRQLDLAETQKHVDELKDQGYSVVEDAIEPALVSELRAALDNMEEERGLGYAPTAFEGRQTLRIYNLLAYNEVFQRIPTHPNTLPIAEGHLDPGLQLSSLSAIILGPDQEAQPIHADTQLIPIPRPHVPISLNCMWALTDFTEANGATRIVPGSHKWAEAPQYGSSHNSIPAEMSAGSVMFFDSGLWHGGGSNRTQERRYGVANYYCAGWIRPQENQQLGIPLELAKTFPRRLQELCSYGIYKGNYGHVESRDPIEVLGREPGAVLWWEAIDKIE